MQLKLAGPLTARIGFLAALSLLPLLEAATVPTRDRIWIDGTINGKRVRLGYDTGTSHPVLFSNAARKLGVKVTPPQATTSTTQGFAGELPRTETCEVSFDKFAGHAKVRFYVVETSFDSEEAFDGLFNWTALPETVVLFTENPQGVRFTEHLPPHVKEWKKVSIREEPVLLLDVPDTNGKRLAVLADSGSQAGVSVSRAIWDQVRAAHPNSPCTVAAYRKARGGPFVCEEIWVDRLTLGTLELHDVPVRCTPEDDKTHVPLDATLGIYAMFRLNLVADPRTRSAYVNPSADRGPAYAHNKLGAVFTPVSSTNDALIATVAKGSPADRAGIRNGDSLLAIGSLDVTQWRTNPRVLPLGRFFEHPAGTPLDLTLERGGQRFDLQVKLENILPPN